MMYFNVISKNQSNVLGDLIRLMDSIDFKTTLGIILLVEISASDMITNRKETSGASQVLSVKWCYY